VKQVRAKKIRSVSCSKKEPLAEGLQITVPTGPREEDYGVK